MTYINPNCVFCQGTGVARSIFGYERLDCAACAYIGSLPETISLPLDDGTRDALALLGSAFETSRDTDMWACVRDYMSDAAGDHKDAHTLYCETLSYLTAADRLSWDL